MPDENDLRFTMELKDEFTEVFNKVKNTVEDVVPKLKANLGGLTKSLAVIGGGLAIGAVVYGAWTTFKNKIADVTKEAEALQSTLANILGSKGAAKNVLEELANSDLSKVFNIKEIDEGYMTLANHGLKATMGQMKAIGDLSAGTGRSFGSVIDAIVRGGEGRTETIKSLGVDVVKDKDKKHGIDNLTLSFRGQTTTIKNNADAIREYLLNLGMIPGVQGSMARSADTVAASENNLSNQITKVWETLGERFNPSVVENKNTLSKWIGTINSWIAIPVSEKIQDEVNHLEGLRAKLGFSTTSETDRKKILEEIKKIQPAVIDNTKSEKEQLDGLNASLDTYIGKRRQQIALEQLKELNLSDVTNYEEAFNLGNKAHTLATTAIGMANALGFNSDGMSQGQAEQGAREFLQKRIDSGKETDFNIKYKGNAGSGIGGETQVVTSKERSALGLLDAQIKINKQAQLDVNKYSAGYAQYTKAQQAIKKLLPDALEAVAGTSIKPDDTKSTKQTSIDKGGIASVHGGGQIRNITINIQNLVSGGVNLQTTTLKEGVSKAKDIVVEGLLTAVNDANLVGN